MAVPVAVVLTGLRVWPDKLAVKLICCANAGIDIIDMDNIQRETIGREDSRLTQDFKSRAAPIVSLLETFKTTLYA